MTNIPGRGGDQMTLLCFRALHAYCTNTESEVGLGWDHVARQQYPLLAQWRGSARVFKGSQQPFHSCFLDVKYPQCAFYTIQELRESLKSKSGLLRSN